jgi:hypothetical protein
MIAKPVIPLFLLVAYLPVFSYISVVSLKAGFVFEGVVCALPFLVLGLFGYRLNKGFYMPKKVLAAISLLLGIVWLFTICKRIIFVIKEGGIERADGYGSPLAIIINIILEGWAFGMTAIFFLVAVKFHRNPAKAQ